MKKYLLCLFLATYAVTVSSQTFVGGGGTIPDNGPAALFPIVVSSLSPNVIDSTFGLESVCININHNNVYQLTIQLMAPDGTTIDLSMNNGSTGNNYTNTCFTATAINSITNGIAPFTGNYKAQGNIGNVNNNQNGNGIWQLKVHDHYAFSIGSVISWSLFFSNAPAYPTAFTSSNLPLIIINTNGQTIVDNPKKIVHMGIIDNGVGVRNYLTDPFNNYNGNIAIEIRGSWSQTFPQQQYGFETLDAANIEADTMVLGMPAQSDWILYAPYNDKTCMRNVLAYDIANKTGHYASRTRFCELIINNDYLGIYVLEEKVKRDSNRVDVSKLLPTDTAGNDITGGYIVKIDKTTGAGGSAGWSSKYDGVPGTKIQFLYEYPSSVKIVAKQKAYIQAYVDSFERALFSPWFLNTDSGYKNYIDVQSFVDYFILNETCKNVDAYRISTFLYKKKNTKGGKLFVGPAWDYNIAFWNADYCEGYLTTGWQYQYNNICGSQGGDNVPFWWTKMLQDPIYTDILKCRWAQLRQSTLHTDTLLNLIDTMAMLLDESKDRHFTRWPVLGTVLWANPQPVANDYAGEISNMKTWIQQRLIWLDANMPGSCTGLAIDDSNNDLQQIGAYPNPFTNKLNVNFYVAKPGDVIIEITDIAGRIIYNHNATYTATGKQILVINNFSFGSGIYILKVESETGVSTIKIVRK